jgi:hypothetical protein
MAMAATTVVFQAACCNTRNGSAQKVDPFLKGDKMFSSYYYPYYRSFGSPMPYPYPWPPYGVNYGSNIVGSAIANQNMNTIGAGAIGGTQIATPTVVW